MSDEFQRWMHWYGKIYSDYLLDTGDFLDEQFNERISSATYVVGSTILCLTIVCCYLSVVCVVMLQNENLCWKSCPSMWLIVIFWLCFRRVIFVSNLSYDASIDSEVS